MPPETGKSMKRLILMRHAKTEPWSEGIDDFGRALTPLGHSDARRMAEELVALSWSPERILVSSARRARETCAEVAAVMTGEKVRPMESLYLTGVRGLTEAVTQNDAAGTLMVIGHNPGLHDFALAILREGGAGDHQASLRLHGNHPSQIIPQLGQHPTTTQPLLRIHPTVEVVEQHSTMAPTNGI